MTEEGTARGKAAFVAQLLEHYRRCEVQSFQAIATLSRTVSLRYPRRTTGDPEPEKPETHLATLSVTTISDVLGGTIRKKLPSWPWTASFVLCCNGWAFDHGVINSDPGRDALPGWAHRRWLAECATERGGIELPVGVRRFLADHGPFGKFLMREVEAGVSDSILLAAILLGCDPAHTNEASALLWWDKASEHPVISSLVTTSLDALDPQTAARCARQLARAARSPDEAAAFNQAADRVGDDPAHHDPHRIPPQPGAPGHRVQRTGPP